MPYYRYSNYSRPSPFRGFRYFPPVIKSLLISNVGVYLLAGFLGVFQLKGIPLGEIIGAVFPLYPLGMGFHVYQLVTYMFMHGGLTHLLFNMFALWMFGMELENDWGSKKFLLFYMICGIGAGLSTLLVGPLFGQAGPTVGASGAIYGVLLAFGMMYPDRPIYFYFLLPIRAKYLVMLYIGLELYAGVAGTHDGIAHFAHLGGAAVGYVFILLDRKQYPLQKLLSRVRGRLTQAVRRDEARYSSFTARDITDAHYDDVHDDGEKITQQRIDEILDKIGQYGYQSLTEEEKKILFEASKKLN
jgi:membrane associated rhomboid family serine protease